MGVVLVVTFEIWLEFTERALELEWGERLLPAVPERIHQLRVGLD